MKTECTLPTIPGYEIRRELGRGGMGVVYEALNIERQRPVAIKMILGRDGQPVDDLPSLLRFRLEAEAVSSLKHRHVVRIHEVGLQKAVPFIVLEYAAKGTLADVVKRGPQRPLAAAQTVHAVATGVGMAHQRGIVHRDLKPSNVLVFDDDLVKVSDFGLTKFLKPRSEIQAACTISIDPFDAFDLLAFSLDKSQAVDGQIDRPQLARAMEQLIAAQQGASDFDPQRETVIASTVEFAIEAKTQLARLQDLGGISPDLTKTGEFMGSPRYMAPEQLRDTSRVGPPADVHSIGCLLYELLTGHPMVPGNTINQIVNTVLCGERASLSTEVSQELNNVYQRCVHPDPLSRYPTANELASDLGRFLGGYATERVAIPPVEPSELPSFPHACASDVEDGRPEDFAPTRRWWPFGEPSRRALP